MAAGSWLVIEELLERGDPAFVEELRACDDAPRLASFAASWHADRRPAARRFLLEYLLRPLNAYHHEPLVKRLFKLAEKAGDDEVMAHFLVLLDRSIRREHSKTTRLLRATVTSKAAADLQEQQWQAQGAVQTGQSGWGRNYHVWGRSPEESLIVPRGSTMPRGNQLSERNPRTGSVAGVMDLVRRLGLGGRPPRGLQDLSEKDRKKLERFRLFTVHTRHYLRRRAWRYFRNLAMASPDRYVPAAQVALKLYEDTDMQDGLALLDNWGLIHILFHDSPALWARSHGWTLRPGRRLDELAPAPAFAELWRQSGHTILDLLRQARCRPVRQWAIFYLRQDRALLDRAPVDVLMELLQSNDSDVIALAATALENRPGLDSIPPERWPLLLQTAPPTALDAVCGLVQARVRSAQMTAQQLVALACSRPVPVARLGFRWLQERAWSEQDVPILLRLTEAEAVSVRPELVRWAREALSKATGFQSPWVLEYLDCRHDDVRAEGWTWLEQDARAHEDVQLWQRLFESPYDDVRLRLIQHLENRYAGRVPALPRQVPLDPEQVRFLWAAVLLNIQRGNRDKPRVVAQIVRRVTERPQDAEQLLPILRVALRSVRGPEWRAGLSGVVQLCERQPDLEKLLRQAFPELQLMNDAR